MTSKLAAWLDANLSASEVDEIIAATDARIAEIQAWLAGEARWMVERGWERR